eukprot:2302164-Pyramimonas_sp.AAC.1
MAASQNKRALLKLVGMLNVVNSALPMLGFEVRLNDRDEDAWKAKWEQNLTNVCERVNVKDKGKDGDQGTTKEEKEEGKTAKGAGGYQNGRLEGQGAKKKDLVDALVKRHLAAPAVEEEAQGPTTADGGDATGAAQTAQPQVAELKSFIESFVAVKAEEQLRSRTRPPSKTRPLVQSFERRSREAPRARATPLLTPTYNTARPDSTE